MILSQEPTHYFKGVGGGGWVGVGITIRNYIRQYGQQLQKEKLVNRIQKYKNALILTRGSWPIQSW